MTVPVWPAEMPRPERSTWQNTPQEARLKRQSDSGPPGYRRRFSSAADLVTLSVVLSRKDKAIFDRFFREVTQRGAVPFWMPDPTTDGWALLTSAGLPILDTSGAPILLSARWLCLFGDTLPVETVQGIEFRKTFSVMVLP